MTPYKYVAGSRFVCTLSDTNTHISSSFLATDKHEIRLVIEELRSFFRDENDLAINKRSISSQVREWATHNLLYDFGICRKRTTSVDLNYPIKWYVEIGYYILSIFY